MVKGREFPEESELVVGSARQVRGFGAFVTLDEYLDKEGFIHLSEIATGWVKHIRDHIREGQKVVCKVLRVNPIKGHIDLSLKRVNDHQRREKIHEWKNEQKAERLFELVAKNLKKDLDTAYNEIGYRLIDTYETLYRAFEESAVNPDTLKDAGFDDKFVTEFVKIAKENIIPPFVEISGYVELTCPTPDGIIHIINALELAEKQADDTVEITVQYEGAPRYRILAKAPEYKIAEEVLRKSGESAIAYIQEHEGEGTFHRK